MSRGIRPYGGLFVGRRRPRIYGGLYLRLPGGGALGMNYHGRVWFKQSFCRTRGGSRTTRIVGAAVLMAILLALLAVALALSAPAAETTCYEATLPGSEPYEAARNQAELPVQQDEREERAAALYWACREGQGGWDYPTK